MTGVKRGEALARVLERSLEKLDLTRRVSAALSAAPPSDRVRLVAVGKAAPAMAEGAFARWGSAIVDALVVTPDPPSPRFDRRVVQVCAGHPIPNAASVKAGKRALSLARMCASDRYPLLVLVSGGTSALLCAPAEGVTLEDKKAVTRAMLTSGASIQEINVVRKHLSAIKGGGLARAAAPARVITLVASDVIGTRGTASDVGSGPSVGDTSTVATARRLLRRFAGSRADAARFAELPLARTGKAPNAVRPQTIASPEELARVVADELRDLGLEARVLPASQGMVIELAREYARRADLLARTTGRALVRAAEPSVTVPSSHGRGGRSTHLATLVARTIPAGVTFMAAATDGVDGSSETAGAIVDAGFREAAGELAITSALEQFRTGDLHLRVGSELPLRPTGHNLADLHVLIS